MDPIRVVVVDDHDRFRQGIVGLLQGQKDIEVIGEASSGRDGIELVSEVGPDVVLMDIAMPGISGLDAARELHDRYPRIGIVRSHVRRGLDQGLTRAELLHAIVVAVPTAGFPATAAAYRWACQVLGRESDEPTQETSSRPPTPPPARCRLAPGSLGGGRPYRWHRGGPPLSGIGPWSARAAPKTSMC